MAIDGLKHLKVVWENVTELLESDPNMFTMLRRNSLGASDSSVVLGVNPFNTVEKLIEQKCSKELTADEIRVANLASVRKGSELEPIILKKFVEWSLMGAQKPTAMYTHESYPWLTVNFDGIVHPNIPVECKLVTKYAEKYWDTSKAMRDRYDSIPKPKNQDKSVEEKAADAGIPIYYYTQVQQQLLFADAPYAYLAAMFDNDWEMHYFMIWADAKVQLDIIVSGENIWNKIVKRRG